MLLGSGIGGLMGGRSMEGVPAPMVPALTMLLDAGLFQLIKWTEVVTGLMLVFGFLPALAVIIVAPLPIGIIIFNAHVAPAFVVSGVIVGLFTVYLGYAYWDKYKAIFER